MLSRNYDILFAKISIREAMERMFVECSCDMDCYLTHRSELEVDLGRQLPPDFDPSDVKAVKKLEQELFYINMCKIFGQENDDDLVEVDNAEVFYNKSFMLRDFRFLTYMMAMIFMPLLFEIAFIYYSILVVNIPFFNKRLK